MDTGGYGSHPDNPLNEHAPRRHDLFGRVVKPDPPFAFGSRAPCPICQSLTCGVAKDQRVFCRSGATEATGYDYLGELRNRDGRRAGHFAPKGRGLSRRSRRRKGLVDIGWLFSRPVLLEPATRLDWENSGVGAALYELCVREHPEHEGWLGTGVDPFTGGRTGFYQWKPRWKGFATAPGVHRGSGKHKEPPKYLSPKGYALEPVFLPVPEQVRERVETRYPHLVDRSLPFWLWVMRNPGIRVIVTEGLKKAGSLLWSGIPAVSIPGVGTCRPHGVLHPWLAALSEGGREILLTFDNDIALKSSVRLALGVLGRLLGKSGAQVRVPQIPDGPDKGIDDWKVSRGEDALLAVLDSAPTYHDWLLGIPALPEGVEHVRICEADIKDILAGRQLPWMTWLKSGLGTGKSAAQIPVVASAATALVTVHRIDLVRQLGQRLGTANYLSHSLASPKMACCIDSLHKLLQEEYEVLILDEVEQVLRHLCGETVARGGHIDEILDVLLRVMDRAKHVVVADAHLGPLTYRKLHRAGETLFIENTHRTGGKMFRRHPRREHLQAAFYLALDGGERAVYCANSKKEIKALAETLAREYPHLKGLAVHADNRGDDVKDFLANIDLKALELDYLLYSPSICTGYSIQARHFDRLFLSGVAGINTPFDLFQQQGRLRHPLGGTVDFWIDSRGRGSFVRSRFVSDAYELIERQSYADPFTTERRRWFSDLFALVREVESNGRLHLREIFEVLAEDEGHTVADAPALAKSAEATAAERAKLGRAQIKHARLVGLLGAPDASPARYNRLVELQKTRGYLPLGEIYECERYRLRNFYGRPVSPELIEDDDEGRLKAKIRRFEPLLWSQEELRQRDADRAEDYRETRPNYRLQNRVMWELLESTGLLAGCDLHTRALPEIAAADLDRFVEVALARRSEIYGLWHLTLPQDFKAKPMQFLRTLLTRLGLKLTCQQRRVPIADPRVSQPKKSGSIDKQQPARDTGSAVRGNPRVRFYRLCGETLEQMLALCEQQAQLYHNQRAIERMVAVQAEAHGLVRADFFDYLGDHFGPLRPCFEQWLDALLDEALPALAVAHKYARVGVLSAQAEAEHPPDT